MVTARSRFLAGSHYDPIAAAVVDALASSPSAGRPIADAGAGTGWLLSRVLDADSARCAGVALDLSKYAARRAAQAHPRILSVVADIWRPLPLASGVFDAVLNFFAPRNASEFARVLAPSGVVVAVTPLASHLCEVRTILPLLRIEPAKHERLAAVMADDFEMAVDHDVAFAMRLSHSDITDLVAMGPSSHHVDDAVIRESITGLPAEVEVTGAVRVSMFRKRNGS
ncbi:MAG: methyltransferase domain-containing protein [Coriobacteriia bacterium]|nr:methyltransferase domain-containing protein [Coriobacteriia bacterium]